MPVDKRTHTRHIGDDPKMLFPVTSDLVEGLYGYVDTQGRMVIEPRFTMAREFSEGLAAVRCWDHDQECCSWGFIDLEGKWVIPPLYKWAYSFVSGQAWANTEEGSVLIDVRGQVIRSLPFTVRIGPRRSSTNLTDPIVYSQTAAWVGYPHLSQSGWHWQPINKYGLVSPSGDFITDPYLDLAGNVGQGLVLVRLRGRMGYVDSKGRVVTGWLKILNGFAFSEDLAAVQAWDRRWGYIDPAGKTIISPTFEMAESFQDGLAPVKRDGQDNWELIDPEGRTVVRLNPKIQQVDSFSEGLAAVRINDLSSYIDTKGNLVFTPQQDFSGGKFRQGYARGFVELAKTYMDRQGQVIWLPDEYKERNGIA